MYTEIVRNLGLNGDNTRVLSSHPDLPEQSVFIIIRNTRFTETL